MDLFSFLTKNGWDFNPLFYYLESYCKSSGEEQFFSHALPRAQSILKIQSIDADRFLNNGELSLNPAAVDRYLRMYDTNSLEEAAEKQIYDFCKRTPRAEILEFIEAIEVALIKMVLIRRFEFTEANPQEQLEIFITFLDQTLDARLAREAHLALHYFNDMAGRFLGIQPNTSWDNAIRQIHSSSWDMLLIRLPELLLSQVSEELILSFIATQEKQLHKLARLFSVQSVTAFPNGTLVPIIDFSMEGLPPEATNFEIASRFPKIKRRSIPTGLHEALCIELRRRLST